jgi:Adenylosuccinate synthetase (EC 6.3.4.4)
MLRHATRSNGFTGLVINHIDVLAGLDEVCVGHSYDLNGEEQFTIPATTERWAECEPNLRSFDPWDSVAWSNVATEGYEAIPANAQQYLEYLTNELDTPIYAIGVGPDRAETIELVNPFDIDA